MKKLSLLLLTLTICFFTACHDDIWNAIDDLDGRVTKLEELCKEMNTNITSLQTIVNVLQSNDYITGVVEVTKNGEVIGYTITFGKHNPITIYHGQDGKDGQNGADGKDGQEGSSSTPVIGVAQDTDGVYYWTLNGEWLLDDNGNKLPVSGTNGKDGQDGTDGKDGQDGTDGKDGQDGTDGKDGQDGADGKDGVTPQLKIEDGYWYISYDNGATWTQLGKATGEDGKDGQNGSNGTDGKDGKDGKDGDSMFQSVTQDDKYVYFTLADGTVIKITKGTSTGGDQPNSEFIFTITYDANGGEGVMAVDTFYYGETKSLTHCSYTKKGHHFRGWNSKMDGTGAKYANESAISTSKNITLYAQWEGYEFVDLGLSVLWATFNIGATSPASKGSAFTWGSIAPNEPVKYYDNEGSLTKYCTLGQCGVIDNKVTLELEDDAAYMNWGEGWRIPTKDEVVELMSKCKWEYSYEYSRGLTISGNGNSIFLNMTHDNNCRAYYWTSSVCEDSPYYAYYLYFDQYSSFNINIKSGDRESSFFIRPVKDKK